LQGQLSEATVNRSIYNKYFLFLVFNVFLGSILASGFFNVLAEIIANPASIPTLLAESLPRQINYFLSYVMILSLSGFAMLLVRRVFALLSFLTRVVARRRRDSEDRISKARQDQARA
jgi:hypothetical protein